MHGCRLQQTCKVETKRATCSGQQQRQSLFLATWLSTLHVPQQVSCLITVFLSLCMSPLLLLRPLRKSKGVSPVHMHEHQTGFNCMAVCERAHRHGYSLRRYTQGAH